MLIKFFATGRGGGGGPTEYCCNTQAPTIVSVPDSTTGRLKSKVLRDDQGKPILKTRHPPPEVLSGNPRQTRELIDSLPFQWRYSSGVIAFAPTDQPSEAQQKQLMAEFEALAFAGMESEQYDILWVRHSHEGTTELHFVIPRVELLTGKSFNPAPPGATKDFATLRDVWNYQHNWARPDDPSRARPLQPGHSALQLAENFRVGLQDAEDPKALITDYALACIEASLIKTRQDLIQELQSAGLAINRQGADYISVRPRPDARPIRLKGALYVHNFNAEAFQKAQVNRLAPQNVTINADALVAKARQSYQDAINKRTRYNQHRYRHSEFQSHQQDLPSEFISWREDLSTSMGQSKPQENREHQIETGQAPILTANPTQISKQQQPDWLTKIKDEYERIRTAFTHRIRTIVQSIQLGHENARSAERQAQSTSDRLVSTAEQIDDACRAIDSIISIPAPENMDKYRQLSHQINKVIRPR